jgi:hypothetical protein
MSKRTGEGLLRFVFHDPHDFLMGDANMGSVYRNFSLVDCPEDTGVNNVSLVEEPHIDNKARKE